ncbi:MAG: hypothetical protein LQ350_006921 [Teloschistes chrysophthalmus]|nr:MAG: hypothetical protein LQ350_006921 [Niorma chrysophthalma]
MSLQTTSVLVVGGCGFLGRHVISELLSATARVSVLDLHTDGNRLETVSYYTGDITDLELLHTVFQKVQPDAIIHSASPVVADFAGKVALYERVNVVGSRNLIETAGQYDCIKVFIYTSSASLTHDGVSDLYISDENDPILSHP